MGTLYLVRHGQASFGADDYDVLSDMGYQQSVRLAAFTHGFFKMHQQSGKAVLTDLRMGQAPSYVFSFALAEQPAGAARTDNIWQTITPANVGGRSGAG